MGGPLTLSFIFKLEIKKGSFADSCPIFAFFIPPPHCFVYPTNPSLSQGLVPLHAASPMAD
jgi:hypothetical protein